MWTLALDVFHIGEHGPQMRTHRPGGGLEVLGFEAIDYCGVLFDQVGNGPSVTQPESTCSVQMSLRGFDGSPRGRVSSRCEEQLMELLVQLEELIHVDPGLGLRCQIGAQGSEVLVRARRDCIFQRRGFYCLPDELRIGNTFGVDA